MLLGWTAGVMFVYAGLFGTGSLIYGRHFQASIWFVLFCQRRRADAGGQRDLGELRSSCRAGSETSRSPQIARAPRP